MKNIKKFICVCLAALTIALGAYAVTTQIEDAPIQMCDDEYVRLLQ